MLSRSGESEHVSEAGATMWGNFCPTRNASAQAHGWLRFLSGYGKEVRRLVREQAPGSIK